VRGRGLATISFVLAVACAAPAAASPPAISIQASAASGGAPFQVTLTAVGDPTSLYSWKLGDGATAAGQTVVHTFGRPGKYTARVTATDTAGETARAQAHLIAYGLSLSAPRVAGYGTVVHLRGRLVPVGSGTVTLRRGRTFLATAALHSSRFRVATRLRLPGPYTAELPGVRSRRVPIVVRPRLTARVVGSALVGTPLAMRVTARPAAAGTLRVRVIRRGRRLERRSATGSLRIPLDTRRPGIFSVRAVLSPRPGFATAVHGLRVTVRPARLELGSRGAGVAYLQTRLRALRYALRSVNGVFGSDTYDAVIAFEKATGLPRTGLVDRRAWGALARAVVPAPRLLNGTHIEVDKDRQLLFAVRAGRVERIVHVSTGATGNTPVGHWHVYRKVPGWDWVLWYPMYFLRGFAVHGYPSVPPFPASHGCVRIPMWLAPSLYASYGYGTLVMIY